MKTICSDCFKNYGLKKIAARLGALNNEICSNCASINGKNINQQAIRDVMEIFFREGTKTPDYQHQIFYLTESNSVKRDWDYPLTDDVYEDLKLINKNFQLSLFAPLVNQRYGWGGIPARFEIEMEIESNLNITETNKKSFKHIDEFIDIFPTRILPEGATLYRIRKNPSNYHNIFEYDTPPVEIAKKYPGRLHKSGPSIFYCSEDEDNCIYECKFEPTDILVMSVLKNTREIKLLDLTEANKLRSELRDIDLFINAIFRSNSDYHISRTIAERADAKKFEGIYYPGFFNRYQKETKCNIGLFGFPIKEKTLEVQSLNRIQINKIEYKWEYGPA